MAVALDITGRGWGSWRSFAEGFYELSNEELDRLAAAGVFLSRRLAWPMARAAAAFTELKGWKEHGFAAEFDFTREKLGRSASWLRLMARIGRAGILFPEMARALSGEDGLPPLNTVSAGWIARVAHFGSITWFIEFARKATVRQVKDAVQAALQKGSNPTPGEVPSPNDDDWDDPDPDHSRRVTLEKEICSAAQEGAETAFELHRSLSGGPATVVSCIEAVCADYELGPGNLNLDPRPLGGFPKQNFTRADQERLHPPRNPLPQPDDEYDVEFFLNIRQRIEDARGLIDRAGQGDGFQVGCDLQELLKLEVDLRRILGRILSKLQLRHAWGSLGFMDLDQYVEERLGLAPSTAKELIQVARFAQRHPQLGEKYDRGEIKTRPALLLARALKKEQDEAVLGRWLKELEQCTVKRLEDELNLRRTRRALGKKDAEVPPDDKSWRESIARPVGYFRRRMAECLRAASVDHTPNRLFRVTLPLDLAQRFLQVLKAAQGEVNTVLGEEGEPALYLERRFGPGRTIAAYRIQGIDDGAFMLVFSRFIQQFDSPDLRGGGKRNPVAERDGYRCTAPGCTVKRNLEVHHVQYRGRGGGDEESNKVLLCLCHHQKGEHIGMMHVRGEAPLNLGYRLGPKERGVWFRNEKCIS